MLISLKYVHTVTLFYMLCPTSSATIQPKIFESKNFRGFHGFCLALKILFSKILVLQ